MLRATCSAHVGMEPVHYTYTRLSRTRQLPRTISHIWSRVTVRLIQRGHFEQVSAKRRYLVVWVFVLGYRHTI